MGEILMKGECDFCNEIKENKTIFNEIYKETLENRIIYSSDNFVVMPTIGQLFKYSMLIIPKFHIETLGLLNNQLLIEFYEVYNKIKKILSDFGYVVAFEHGAKECTGGGCGIYHAHLHMVPLPKDISLFSFYKHNYIISDTIIDALNCAKNSNEYLIAVNSDNIAAFLDLDDISDDYKSQFFRRKLHSYFKLKNLWNWKEYKSPEEYLLRSNELIIT